MQLLCHYMYLVLVLAGLPRSVKPFQAARLRFAPRRFLLSATEALSPTPEALSPVLQLSSVLSRTVTASDARHNSGLDGASTGWSDWVDPSMSLELQTLMSSLRVVESSQLFKWLASSPSEVATADLSLPNATEYVKGRVAVKLYVAKSGASLVSSSAAPPGSITYTKCLKGGVRTWRVLSAGRKGGERSLSDESDAVVSYGGTGDGVTCADVGCCAFLRVSVVPINFNERGFEGRKGSKYLGEGGKEGVVGDVEVIDAEGLLRLEGDGDGDGDAEYEDDAGALVAAEDADGSLSMLKANLGGLDSELRTIVRRVLPLRSVDPATKELLSELGIRAPKGILLHGPPGCGKTAVARALSEVLTERAPKIVNAPELMSRWVGGSERAVRELFGDALDEWQERGEDSAIHVVIIDEIDSCFRERGGVEGDGGGMARDSTVNQLLGILDGVKRCDNILLVAMTNRRNLLDSALLRSGRLEVQVHIPKPTTEGRQEIIDIFFRPLRESGKLTERVKRRVERNQSPGARTRWGRRRKRGRSLAEMTAGWTGADIEALVRSAVSFALDRDASSDGWCVGEEDLELAVNEISKSLR